MMLSEIYRAQQAKRESQRRAVEIAKKDAIDATQKVNRTLTLIVNKDVMKVHSKQQELENCALFLQQETQKFVKQTNQWSSTLTEMHKAMEKIRDIDTWAKNIEDQLVSLTSALEHIAKEERMASVNSPLKKNEN